MDSADSPRFVITHWYWLVGAAVFVAVNLGVPRPVFKSLAFAAGCTGLAAWADGDLSVQAQVIVFGGLFMIGIMFGRGHWGRRRK